MRRGKFRRVPYCFLTRAAKIPMHARKVRAAEGMALWRC